MQGVDMVIAGVGVVAVVATVLGVVFYDEVAGVEEIRFTEFSEMDALDPESVQADQDNGFPYALPPNATAARADITVRFSGQAGQGGDVAVSIFFEDPTGNRTKVGEGTLTIGQASEADSVEIETETLRWMEVPAPQNVTDGSVDETKVWDEPLRIIVQLGAGPGGPLDNVAGVTEYNYEAEITELEIFQYREAPRDIPDPQAGQ